MKRQICKLLAILLAIAMVAALVPGMALAEEGGSAASQGYEFTGAMPTDKWEDAVQEAPNGYSEDEDNKITISSAEGLAWLAKQVNSGTDNYSGKTVTLTDSVDLKAHLWTPIGTDTHPFKGTFDGGNENGEETGIKITGVRCSLTTTQTNIKYFGLFGKTEDATLKNVTLGDVVLKRSNTYSGYDGTLAGNTTNTQVEKCHVSNSMVATRDFTGGLIGYAFTGSVSGCTVDHVSVSGEQYVGGICGQGYAQINNCTVTNSVVKSTHWKVGGIVGQSGEGSRTYTNDDVKNVTLISGFFGVGTEVGGIIGFVNYSSGVDETKLKDCDVEGLTIEGISSHATSPRITLLDAGGLIGSFHYGKLELSNCSVKDVLFKKNETDQASETLFRSVGGVIGGMYWRSNISSHDYSITLDSVAVSDIQFECDKGEGIGTLMGVAYAAADGEHTATNTIKSSSVDKNSVTKSSVNGEDNFNLRIIGSNYPEGTIAFDNTKSTVTFDGENELPVEDLTAYPANGENLVASGSEIFKLVAVYQEAKTEFAGSVSETLRAIENPFSKGDFKKTFLDTAIKEISYDDVTSLADTPSEGNTIYVHITPILRVEQLSATDTTLSLRLTPQYTAVANTDAESSEDGTILKDHVELALDWPVTLTVPLGDLATGNNFVDIRHTPAGADGTEPYIYAAKITEDNTTFTSGHGLGQFDIMALNGPPLASIKVANVSGAEPAFEYIFDTSALTGAITVPAAVNKTVVTPDMDSNTDLFNADVTYSFLVNEVSAGSIQKGGIHGDKTAKSIRPQTVELNFGETTITVVSRYLKITIPPGAGLGGAIRENQDATYTITVTRELPIVTIDQTSGGTVEVKSVEVDSENPKQVKVTFTVTPDEEYELLSAMYTSGNSDESVETTENEDGTYTYSVGYDSVIHAAFKLKESLSDDATTIVDEPVTAAPSIPEGNDKIDDSLQAEDLADMNVTPYDETAKDMEDAALKAAEGVDKDKLDSAVEALKGGDGTEVYIHVLTTFETEVEAYDREAGVMVLDITPRYHVIATTAQDKKDIVLAGNKNNAVQLTEGDLDVTKPVNITVPIPADLAGEDEPVYIKHEKDGGKVYWYTGTVKDGAVTFTNPDGFSTFEIRNTTTAQASITVGDETKYYNTLQEAVDAVKEGETITVLTGDPMTATAPAKNITFTVENGDNVTIQDNGNYHVSKSTDGKYTVTYVAPPVPTTPTPSKPDTPDKPDTDPVDAFVDVPAGAWYRDALNYVLENTTDVINGTDATHFSPNEKLTRAAFAKILWAIEGSKPVTADNPFTDVKSGDWFYDAVIWANAQGIMLGKGENLCAPNDNITREEMALMIQRWKAGKAAGEVTFPDAKDVHDWAADAVAWAAEQSYIKGKDDGRFAPLDSLTRAEMITVVARTLGFEG